MDSISLNAEVTVTARVIRDNGSINPTTFAEHRISSLGYSTVGSATTQINCLHYKSYVLEGAETIAINLATGLENPVDVDGGNLATITIFDVHMQVNEDGSTGSASIRFGGSSSVPVQMWMGDVSQTFDVMKGGRFLWDSELGVARGGTLLKVENLDPTNDATFVLMIAGRS